MHIRTRAAYLESCSGVGWSCENDTWDLLKARGKSATKAHHAVAQEKIKPKSTNGMSAMPLRRARMIWHTGIQLGILIPH